MPRKKKLPSAAQDVHLTKKKYFEIKFLKALEISDGMFASDFVKIATEKDEAGMRTSESTVYNYLKEFQEEGVFYYDEKTRKYHSSEKGKVRFAIEQMIAELKNLPEWMLDLGRKVLEAVNQQIREEKAKRSEVLINLWGKWISAIALYCLGKEIETGESFWFVLAHYLTYVSSSRAHIRRHIIYEATPDLELKELISLFGRGVALGEKEAYADGVVSYFENLRSVYPKEIETLERIFQNEGMKK